MSACLQAIEYGPCTEAATPTSAVAPERNATPTPTGFRLHGTVWVDFALDLEGDGHSELVVRVLFPDDARGVLEQLSWCTALTIVDTVVHIGAVYIMQAMTVVERRVFDGPRGAQARVAEVQMPLSCFQAELLALRAGDRPM